MLSIRAHVSMEMSRSYFDGILFFPLLHFYDLYSPPFDYIPFFSQQQVDYIDFCCSDVSSLSGHAI